MAFFRPKHQAPNEDEVTLEDVRNAFLQGRATAAIGALDTLLLKFIRNREETRARSVMTEFWPRIEARAFRATTAAALARLLDADGSLHMALPLFEHGGEAPGFVGVKSLIRAVEIHLGNHNEAAVAVLERLDAIGDHGPFAAQVNSLRPGVARIAAMRVAPENTDLKLEHEVIFNEVPAPAPVKLRSSVPEALYVRLHALNFEGIVAENWDTGKFEIIEWQSLVAVAAGAVPRAFESGLTGSMLLVDLVIARPSETAAARSYRFDSDTTSMSKLCPAPTAPDSFKAFFTKVFASTEAVVALPDIGALQSGKFPQFDSAQAREKALYSRPW